MHDSINTGDTAWVLVSCALVLVMTPALGFFYGGLVRRKNILSTLTLSYVFMALIGVQWVLFGYSLAFGTDIGGLIGGLDFIGFNGVGAAPNPTYSSTIPHEAFAAFQIGWSTTIVLFRHRLPGKQSRRLHSGCRNRCG